MIKTFVKCTSELGTLHFSDSGENSYAITSYGVLVTKTHDLEVHDEVQATIVCNGIAINKFTLRLTEKDEVRLHAKRKALHVPEALGGFKFGKEVFRTVMAPTDEVPIYEVPFEAQCEAQCEAQQDEVSSEVLIGLA